MGTAKFYFKSSCPLLGAFMGFTRLSVQFFCSLKIRSLFFVSIFSHFNLFSEDTKQFWYFLFIYVLRIYFSTGPFCISLTLFLNLLCSYQKDLIKQRLFENASFYEFIEWNLSVYSCKLSLFYVQKASLMSEKNAFFAPKKSTCLLLFTMVNYATSKFRNSPCFPSAKSRWNLSRLQMHSSGTMGHPLCTENAFALARASKFMTQVNGDGGEFKKIPTNVESVWCQTPNFHTALF